MHVTPIQIPNFEIEREIGRGGMSRVYLARQLSPSRAVAIKIVAPSSDGDDSLMQALKCEGDIIAALSHENIVTIHAAGMIEVAGKSGNCRSMTRHPGSFC